MSCRRVGRLKQRVAIHQNRYNERQDHDCEILDLELSLLIEISEKVPVFEDQSQILSRILSIERLIALLRARYFHALSFIA